jgi:hypothetical protein
VVLDRETTFARVLGGAQLSSADAVDVAALQHEASELLEAVALGRDEETLARGTRVLEREGGRLASLGRDDAAARALSDSCLFVARAFEHRRDHAAARAQIRQCWRLVPDLSAPTSLHPPEIRALLAQARTDEALARVHVTTRPSEGAGCTLRVQGRPSGALPARLELVPGSYTFQVDCSRPGFVHSRTVAAGAELQLELAVELEQRLSFDRDELALTVDRAHRGTSAQLTQLAERLGVAELWTVQVRERSVRLARLAARHARVDLLGERAIALTPAATLAARADRAVAQLACAPACMTAADEPPEHAAHVLAYVGAGAGVAALTASWLLFARYAALDADLDTLVYDTPGYARDLDARDVAGTAALLTSASGSALLAGTAPWWLPRARGVPWPAWVAGTAGALGAGIGVALWAEHGELRDTACRPFEVCSRRQSRVPLAPMLVTQGAALLVLPITYALRAPEQDTPAVSLRASSSRLELLCSGRFGAF